MSTQLHPSRTAPTKDTGTPTIWLDGQWCDRSTAMVSVYDHGLLYGDGVFEGIRVYGGKIFKLAEHLDRLYDSAQAIWLTVPMSKEEMAQVTEEAVRRSGITEAYIRHIVSRGVGDLGLDPRKCPRPSVIIIVDTIKLWPEEVYETGLKVVTAGTPIPQRESLSPRVKSLNYLPHILAKIEGVQAGADEVLMLDSQGHVAEGSGQNIFVVKRRRITTPPVYAGILKGVTRDVVIELARGAGYEVDESMINRYDVYTADEAFFTGTASEVVAIRQVDGRLVGAGKSGPVTRDLRARFQALVRS
ncbi:MAG TPA: branched-chain-amino-acid transaminase [Gemmatimonadales bacterium]|nr:branched-chain-amino-acid transaminase [Gemmatimonadales bacterium]